MELNAIMPFWLKPATTFILLQFVGIILGSDDLSGIRDLLLQTNLLEEKDFLLWTSDSRGFVPLHLQCRFELEIDEGCPQRYLEEMPYVWQYNYDVDPTMFLQMDLQRPHWITRIKQVHVTANEGASSDDSLYIDQVKVTFSRDGRNWSELEVLGCDFVPSSSPTDDTYLARYIRFFVTESGYNADGSPMQVSFVPFGYYSPDYPAMNQLFEPEACTGHQARADLRVVTGQDMDANLCSDSGLHIKAEVQQTSGASPSARTPVYDSRGQQDLGYGHIIFSAVTFYEDYDRCEVAFVVESLQFEYSGTYFVVAENPVTNHKYIDESFDLQVEDDGEPLFSPSLTNGEVDYFAVVHSIEKYFVFILPYSLDTTYPALQQISDVRVGCRGIRGADVASNVYLQHFQAGGINGFAQTVILNFLQVPNRLDAHIEDKYIVFIKDGYVWCMYVEDETVNLVLVSCPTGSPSAGILCFMTDGESNTIEMSHTGCSVDSSDNTVGSLQYDIFVDVVGCGHMRDLACRTYDDFGNVLFDDLTPFGCRASNEFFKTYNLAVTTAAQVTTIRCSLTRRVYMEIPIESSVVFQVDRFQEDLQLQVDNSMVVRDRHYIYLTPEHYGNPYEIKFTSIGYPVSYYMYMFTQFNQNPEDSLLSDDGMTSSLRLVCGELGNATDINIRVDGVKRVPNLTPMDSGLYTFVLNSNLRGRERNESCTLVHPFSIQCENTCPSPVEVSQPFETECTINHHMLAAFVPFVYQDQVPVKMVFQKVQNSPDLEPIMFEELSQCEFENVVEKPLYYSNRIRYIQWNFFERNATVRFKIFATQPWHVGKYYFEVIPTPENCVYQRETDDLCFNYKPLSPCESRTTSNKIEFHVQLQSDPGWPSFDPVITENVCGPNVRSIYVEDPNGTPYGYFYKACLYPEDVFSEMTNPDKEVCKKDGGKFVPKSEVFLQNSTVASSLRGFVAGYSDANLWRTIACNAYTRNPLADVGTDKNSIYFSLYTPEEASRNTLFYYNNEKEAFSKAESTDREPVGILCRYRKGEVWRLRQKETDCKYEPLDVAVGQTQHVDVDIHGNITADIRCIAFPPGSSDDKFFTNVSKEHGLDYTLDIKTDFNVEFFGCEQIAISGIQHRSDVFTNFTFTSLPKELVVAEKLRYSDNLFCEFSGSNLFQPCFGQEVSLKCCADGNPIKNCTWMRRVSEHGKFPEGQAGVSIFWEKHEEPQCDLPGICTNITFSPLSIEHSGIYSCICYNGLEDVEELRSKARVQTEGIPLFGYQTIPVKERDFEYSVKCKPAEILAHLLLIGPPVEAHVYCKEYNQVSEEQQMEINMTLPGSGVTRIDFNVSGATRDTSCRLWSSNEFSRRNPLQFVSYFSQLQSVTDVSISWHGSKEQPIVCCDICAFSFTKESRLSFKCEMTRTGALIPFKTNSVVFTSDVSTNSARKCAQMEKRPRQTFQCSCFPLLDPTNAGVYTFFGNGDEQFMTAAPPVVEEEFIQPNISQLDQVDLDVASETTSKSDDPMTTEDPLKNVHIVELTYDEYQLLLFLRRILDLVTDTRRIDYLVLLQEFRTMTPHLKGNIASDKAVSNLLVFKYLNRLEGLRYSNNSVLTEDEQQEQMLTELVEAMLLYFDTNLEKSSQLTANEFVTLELIEQFVQSLHVIAQMAPPGEMRKYSSEGDKYDFCLLKVSQEMGDAGAENVSCKYVDNNGVNRGSLQGVELSRNMMQKLEVGSTVVICGFDRSLSSTYNIMSDNPQVFTLQGSDEFEQKRMMRRRFTRRVTDTLTVSIAPPPDPNSEPGSSSQAPLDIEVDLEYSLNLADANDYTHSELYKVDVKFFCAYYDVNNKTYSSYGQTASFMSKAESRGVCHSDHTTAFALVGDITEEKLDDATRTHLFWIVWIGMALASVVTLATFLVLLYVDDHLDEQENRHHMSLLFFYQLFICSYLAGADKIERGDSTQCRLTSFLLHLFYFSIRGCLLNIALCLWQNFNPKLWTTHFFYLAYIINIAIIPALISFSYFGLFKEDIGQEGGGYSCFPSVFRNSFHYCVSIPSGLSILVTAVMYRVSYVSGTYLFTEAEDPTVLQVFKLNLQNNIVTFMLFTVVISTSVWIMSLEKMYLHVVYSLVILFGTLAVCAVMLFIQPEIMAAIRHKNKRKPYVLRKKPKRKKNYEKFDNASSTRPSSSGDVNNRDSGSRMTSPGSTNGSEEPRRQQPERRDSLESSVSALSVSGDFPNLHFTRSGRGGGDGKKTRGRRRRWLNKNQNPSFDLDNCLSGDEEEGGPREESISLDSNSASPNSEVPEEEATVPNNNSKN